MGRKRKPRKKKREPITISLPKDLVDEFDDTLGDNTRSKTVESLIRRHLRISTKTLDYFARHHYECLDCGRHWHQRIQDDLRFMFCIGQNGCNSNNIAYRGIYEEEE